MMEEAATLNSVEYQLLQAYCTKRRKKRQNKCPVPASGMPMRRMREDYVFQSGGAAGRERGGQPTTPGSGEDGFSNVAIKLTQIADHVHLVSDSDDIEVDSDDVIQRLVELLKESGDKLNEEIKRNHVLADLLQTSFSYSLFEKVTTSFLQCVVPSGPTRAARPPQRAQIAMAFEVTSRLTTLDLHPMNRAMGFGAQYLQQHFAGWVQRHGGWEKAFNTEDSDDEVQ